MTLVRRFPPIAIVVLSWSLLVHIGAAVVWRAGYAGFQPFVGYQLIAGVALLTSVLLSAGEFLVADLRWFRVILLARAATVLSTVALFPLDAYMLALVPCTLFCEIATYEDYPENVLFSAGAWTILLAVALRQSAGDNPLDAVVPLAVNLPLIFSGALLTRYRGQTIGLMRDVARLDRALVELSATSTQYLRQASTASERSTKEERDRITRDLHDSIGYTLTNLIMMMHSAQALASVDAEKLRRTLDAACEQATIGLAETRRALYRERQQSPGDAFGLPALDRMIRSFEAAAGVKAEVHYRNSPISFGPEVDDLLFHFVEEGLTNSFRHGRADRVRLDLWLEHDTLRVTLWDNGAGSHEFAEGIGLTGMRERLGAVGGTLEVGGVPDGFQISAEIPL